MKAALVHASLVVAIGHEEACRLVNGEQIGDRINPLCPDAKIVLRHMRDYDPEYEPVTQFGSSEFGARQRAVCCIAKILGDQDIVIYVPPEIPWDARIASEHIPRDRVQTGPVDDPEGLVNTLPEEGIFLRFDSGRGDHEFYELVHSGVASH